MRVRIAVGLAMLAAAIGLAVDMSGAAPRLAGSDHVYWPPPNLVDPVQGPATLCVSTVLPADARRFVMTVGSYGHPLPRIAVDFTPTGGRRLAVGVLRAGAAEGAAVSVPLRAHHGPSAFGNLCMHIAGHRPLVFGGQTGTGGATVNGVTAPSSVSILFYRGGRESWWQLLGALDLRIGLGKSAIFGDWTLPVLALLALGLWVAVARLLVREMRR